MAKEIIMNLWNKSININFRYNIKWLLGIIKKYKIKMPEKNSDEQITKKQLVSIIEDYFNKLESFESKKRMVADIIYNLIHIEWNYYVDRCEIFEPYSLIMLDDNLNDKQIPEVRFNTIDDVKKYLNEQKLKKNI